MAELVVQQIKFKSPLSIGRESSTARQAAKKAGIEIPKLNPSLPEVEQEASDID